MAEKIIFDNGDLNKKFGVVGGKTSDVVEFRVRQWMAQKELDQESAPKAIAAVTASAPKNG
jgi:hypothetical protein